MFSRTCAIVLLSALTGFAFAGKEKAQPAAMLNDVAPNLNHHSGAIDDQWDVVFDWIVEYITGDNRCLGCEFDGTYFWVSGAGASGTENNIHLLDANGNYVSTFQTVATSYWGLRDLCFDGTYIYGGWESGFECYDAETQSHVATLSWPAGQQFPRASAYDPEGDNGNGSFYTGNFGNPMYEFDREGNLIRELEPGPNGVYGMAWDDYAPNGPWLYIHDQGGGSGMDIWTYDPVTGSWTGEIHSLNNLGIYIPAGGLAYSHEWNPNYTILIAIGQSGFGDSMGGWEMYPLNWNIPEACQNLTIAHNNAELLTSLSWINPSLTMGGEPLTELLGVKVERNYVLIADLTDVVMGEPYAYDDPVPEPDTYTYTLVPYNSYGNGLATSESMWIGLDVCGPPENVVATPNPFSFFEATITWDDPTTGVHPGAYWPPGSFDYFNIYRNGNQIAAGVTGNEYIDYPLIAGWYVYGVTAVNASGEGLLAEWPEIYVGPVEFFEIPYEWFEIRDIGTNAGITGDDQNVGPFDIGFNCLFYNAFTYDAIRICSNGWLSFTSTANSFDNDSIPDPDEPNNLIAPYWDDLNLNSSTYGHGAVYYYQDIVNSRFIVEFDSVAHYGQIEGEYFTFQAILYPDATIDFMYKDIEPGNMSPFPSATIGRENSIGSEGLLVTYNGSGPLEPVSQSGIRMFFVASYPLVTVELTPAITPIQIPASGGSFEFNVELNNLGPYQYSFDTWAMATLPDGRQVGPLIGPVALTLNSGASVNRDRIQEVPASAPAGNYTYDAYTGIYSSVIWQEDHFDFEKLAAGDGGAAVSGWRNWGETFPGEGSEEPISSEYPSEYGLSSAYPNPFNPVTRIAYTLPERTMVKLTVYDITGREAVVLVDGWVNEGMHEALFDGSKLASGVYFCRLTTGSFSEVRKIILQK